MHAKLTTIIRREAPLQVDQGVGSLPIQLHIK